MTKRTLLTTCLTVALVLGLAASGFAAVWIATTGVGTEYTKSNNSWTSEAVTLTGGGAPLELNFDIITKGSWDGVSDPVNTKPTTLDTFTVNIYKAGVTAPIATYGVDIDNPDLRPDALYARSLNLSYLLPDVAGVYTFELISKQTALDETWILSGGSLNPTPLPAAVWMLGSALLGAMGFKARKNSKAPAAA